MKHVIDNIINLLKWPVAIYALLILPAFVQSLSHFSFFNLKYMALVGGFIFFFIFYGSMDKHVKGNMSIVGHELIHALFALLTFHKVTSLKASDDNTSG